MRVLIIGCGYVGQALGSALLARGDTVYGLRRTAPIQSPSGPLDPPDGAPMIRPLVGDITRPADLTNLPGPFDWIINTASSGGGGLEDYRRVYLEGTQSVLSWLQPAPPRKYLYTSSTGVYAQNDGSWVDETSPTQPSNPTSQVLIETEQLLLQTWATQHFPAIILRVAGIYGPGRGYFFRQFLKNEASIEGAGDRLMNMIHRDDVAGAIIAALERGHPGQVYNAVDDEPVTQKAFYDWLSATLGKPWQPSATLRNPTQRFLTNKKVSNRKLKHDLRYQFLYPTFRQGYAREIAALQEQAPSH